MKQGASYIRWNMKNSSVKKRTIKKTATKKQAVKKSAPKKTVAKKKVVKKPRKKPIKKSTPVANNKIVLKAVLAINDAKVIYAELGTKLATKKNISIDASAVEMVDTAILQLLLAFIQKAILQNILVTWVKPSQAFLSRSDALNLTGLLGLEGSTK